MAAEQPNHVLTNLDLTRIAHLAAVLVRDDRIIMADALGDFRASVDALAAAVRDLLANMERGVADTRAAVVDLKAGLEHFPKIVGGIVKDGNRPILRHLSDSANAWNSFIPPIYERLIEVLTILKGEPQGEEPCESTESN